jgi:hypothetical protein
MAFVGRIHASINRYGQETIKSLRPLTRVEIIHLRTCHNAVSETLYPERSPIRKLVTVSPEDLNGKK